jgi:hypothetical protein
VNNSTSIVIEIEKGELSFWIMLPSDNIVLGREVEVSRKDETEILTDDATTVGIEGSSVRDQMKIVVGMKEEIVVTDLEEVVETKEMTEEVTAEAVAGKGLRFIRKMNSVERRKESHHDLL